jgi:hypothetical protein
MTCIAIPVDSFQTWTITAEPFNADAIRDCSVDNHVVTEIYGGMVYAVAGKVIYADVAFLRFALSDESPVAIVRTGNFFVARKADVVSLVDFLHKFPTLHLCERSSQKVCEVLIF